MAEIKYVIRLAPITKKNSQQILHNSKTGAPFIAPSKQYKQYAKDAVWFLRPAPPRPIDCPVNIRCLFYLRTNGDRDLTNLLEAIDDILIAAKIIKDDNYKIVAGHDGCRCYVDPHNPRTEIYITKMPADEQLAMEGMT